MIRILRSGNRLGVVEMGSDARDFTITPSSVKLMIGASVYLGKGVGWEEYEDLYRKVYVGLGLEALRPDGYLLVIQTDAYVNGQVLPRNTLLPPMLLESGFDLLDRKVWQRRRADHFQPPFSEVFVFRRSGGTASRTPLNKHNGYFQGVWDYPQSKGGAHAGYPPELCRMIVEAFTEEGDLILDPFAGTGKLIGVASEMGRRAVGCEIDEELIQEISNNLGASPVGTGTPPEPPPGPGGITVRTLPNGILPDWQRDIPLEALKEVTGVLKANDEGMILGAFTRFSEVMAAKVWAEGNLFVVRDKSGGAVAVAVARRTKVKAQGVKDFTGEVACRLPLGTIHVTRFGCLPGHENELLGLLEGVRDGAGGFAVECWHERPLDRAIVRLLGLHFVALKIRASSEQVSVWSDSVRGRGLSPTDVPALARLLSDQFLLEDALRLANAIPADPSEIEGGAEWTDHYSSYNKKRSWSALVLRGYGGRVDFVQKPDEMSRKWKKENPEKLEWTAEDTPLRAALPEVERILSRIPTTRFDRIRLMRLSSGGSLGRHADITDKQAGTADGALLRLHLPIETNEGVIFSTVDAHGRMSEARMRLGELWSLDTRKPHAARNQGPTDRVHLVIDCESTEALREMFPEDPNEGIEGAYFPGPGIKGWEEFSDLEAPPFTPSTLDSLHPEPIPRGPDLGGVKAKDLGGVKPKETTQDLRGRKPKETTQDLRGRKPKDLGGVDSEEKIPRWMIGDSRKLLRSIVEPIDLLFSCPPYFDLEVYSDLPGDISDADDYPAFLEAYREIIWCGCSKLRDDRFAVWVVGDVRDGSGNYRGLVGDTVRAFEDAGLRLYNHAVLVTPLGSVPVRAGRAFERGRKLGKTHQDVLVFIKGDAKKATEACGAVEFGKLEESTD